MAIHGFVDAAKEVRERFTRRVLRQAYRNGNRDMNLVAFAGDAVGAIEARGDLAGTCFGVGLFAGENGNELVTTPAADEIACAYLTAEPGG